MWPRELNADDSTSEALAEAVAHELRTAHAAFVRHFPSEVAAFATFLSHFGTPLPYYGARVGEGTHPLNAAVHRVRYDADAARRGELHGLDGELPLHSAQSQRDPRPRYFAMLMVSPGALTSHAGNNGESLIASWRSAAMLVDSNSDGAWTNCARLLGEPAPLGGSVMRPMVYPLEDAVDQYDIGVRMKYGLVQAWQSANLARDQIGALQTLLGAANDNAIRVERQMLRGDLLILDNNRFAHGRRAFCGEASGSTRELWSVTLA